jgi:hypothetical protein
VPTGGCRLGVFEAARQLQEVLPVSLQLPLADFSDGGQLLPVARTAFGHLHQGDVVEDDIGRHAPDSATMRRGMFTLCYLACKLEL